MDARTWILVVAIGSQVVEQVVVKVNGEIISRSEIEERVRVALAQERGHAISTAEVRADPHLQAQARALTPRLIGDAIDEILLVQWARERGLEADEDDAARVIAQMRVDNKIETDAAFEALLIGEGIAPASLRDSVRRQITIERVRRQESDRVLVRDTEARAYYHQHPEQFLSAPAVTFNEIVVRLPGPDHDGLPAERGRQYDEGLIRFVSAQERVKRGEDFSAVARALSESPSRDEGGAVGPVSLTDLPKPEQDALVRLADGEVSPPIRTDAGYVLVKRGHVSPAVPPTFEAWRAEAVRRAQEAKRASAFGERLRDLRAQAVIDWKDRELEAACVAIRGRPCDRP
jgi:hypothetical protein